MSVNEMIARQTRIERQEAAHCASVSFERHAANAFQSYVRDALAFSIKRGGILYGCACCPSSPCLMEHACSHSMRAGACA